MVFSAFRNLKITSCKTNHSHTAWLSFLCGILPQSFRTVIFPSVEFRNLSATKCIMIQADINLCCKNIDQTFAVLFVEVAFVLIVVLQMLFVCICVSRWCSEQKEHFIGYINSTTISTARSAVSLIMFWWYYNALS